jgi:hypothetical protein
MACKVVVAAPDLEGQTTHTHNTHTQLTQRALKGQDQGHSLGKMQETQDKEKMYAPR